MKLNELPKILAYSRNKKRRGKGVGSGQGKTAGRGHKGGKARSGYSPAPCCSGVPFYRHLPIRGFSNARFRTEYATVDLQRLVDLDLETVDKSSMREFGLIRDVNSLVKVLGGDENFSKSITVIADKFSRKAAEKIARAGGKAISLLDSTQE
jgi:large subunit ribosomal protein L15